MRISNFVRNAEDTVLGISNRVRSTVSKSIDEARIEVAARKLMRERYTSDSAATIKKMNDYQRIILRADELYTEERRRETQKSYRRRERILRRIDKLRDKLEED